MSHDTAYESGIYTATYSGIPVVEMVCRGVAVMKRIADSYLNATQILKIAGVDKGRRTKILEKEILAGTHDKVQGGYGKYQGTWIPFERGMEFCHQYGVVNLIQPLLAYDPSSCNDSLLTPTKEEALAARRRQAYASNNGTHTPSYHPTSTPILPSPSPIPVLMNHARGAPPILAPLDQQHHHHHHHHHHIQDDTDVGTSINNLENHHNQAAAMNGSSYVSTQPTSGHKRTASDIFFDKSLAKVGGSLSPADTQPDSPTAKSPLPPSSVCHWDRSREQMMNLFLETDQSRVRPILQTMDSALNVDVPIDEYGHTALHWAATLGRSETVSALIQVGAETRRVNFSGETALIRAVQVTNNLDQSSFPKLLDLLHDTIPITDHEGKTVLHHIALTAGIKGRSAACRYYLECLLEWVVKKPSVENGCIKNLRQFVGDVVDKQDRNGDSALCIAARIGNKAIVQQLLDIGADPMISNRAGLRALDFDIGISYPSNIPKSPPKPLISPSLATNNKETVSAISDMLGALDKSFLSEMEEKQQEIDSVRAGLLIATRKMTESRKKLANLRSQAAELAGMRQRRFNMEKAIHDEEARFLGIDSKLYNSADSITSEQAALLSYEGNIDADAPFIVRPLDGMGSSMIEASPSHILRARIDAYQKNNQNLESLRADLRIKGVELENKCKRVVALCTGVEESRVDSLLEGLVTAVESDGNVEDISLLEGFVQAVNQG